MEEITHPVAEPMAANEPGTAVEPKRSRGLHYALLLLVLALLAFLSLGGFWFLKQSGFNLFTSTSPEPSPIAGDEPVTEPLEDQGTSDEIDEIEVDVTNTDLGDLDKELKDIESELGTP